MIGDFILWLKRIFHEMFCIHEYEQKITKMFEVNYLQCRKCGRIRK